MHNEVTLFNQIEDHWKYFFVYSSHEILNDPFMSLRIFLSTKGLNAVTSCKLGFQLHIKQNIRTQNVILDNTYLIKILVSSNLVIPSNDRHNKWILKSVLTVTCGILSQNQSGLSQSSPHLITLGNPEVQTL